MKCAALCEIRFSPLEEATEKTCCSLGSNWFFSIWKDFGDIGGGTRSDGICLFGAECHTSKHFCSDFAIFLPSAAIPLLCVVQQSAFQRIVADDCIVWMWVGFVMGPPTHKPDGDSRARSMGGRSARPVREGQPRWCRGPRVDGRGPG